MADEVPEITVSDLKERLDRGERITIVDVREPYEWEIGNLGEFGAKLIPLAELDDRLDELEPEDEIVVQCRSGNRSGRAVRYLQARGFLRARNLKGGILAWSDEIDPSIPKY
jgi:sulfur-carrier protein adenylyltransferase/sulfurtransferase